MKQSSDDLLKVSLEVISNQKCSEQLKDEPYDPINPSQICAGGERNKVSDHRQRDQKISNPLFFILHRTRVKETGKLKFRVFMSS